MKKKILLLSLLLVCASSFLSAAIFTVNNNLSAPGGPGQFADIGSAITAASVAGGDTIFVAGSLTDYPAFSINKKVTILGPGYNPDKENPLPASVNGAVTFSSSAANGSIIMGMTFKSSVSNTIGSPLNGIVIRRNCFKGASVVLNLQADSISNFQILENIFNLAQLSFYKASTLVIKNNVFTSQSATLMITQSASATRAVTAVTVDHNLFLFGSFTTPLVSSSFSNAMQLRNGLVTNNIFYNLRCVDTAAAKLAGVDSNNTFNKNITFAGAALPTLPYTNSNGTGNINNTDPQLTAIFTSSTNPNIDFNLDNLRLKATSPALGTATDLTDIGPTGGVNPIYLYSTGPLTGTPPVPQVRSMYLPTNISAVPQGSTINVNMVGRKRN